MTFFYFIGRFSLETWPVVVSWQRYSKGWAFIFFLLLLFIAILSDFLDNEEKGHLLVVHEGLVDCPSRIFYGVLE